MHVWLVCIDWRQLSSQVLNYQILTQTSAHILAQANNLPVKQTLWWFVAFIPSVVSRVNFYWQVTIACAFLHVFVYQATSRQLVRYNCVCPLWPFVFFLIREPHYQLWCHWLDVLWLVSPCCCTQAVQKKKKNPADRTLLETLTLSTLVHIDLFAFYENATHVNSNERSIHSKSPSWKSIHQKYRSIITKMFCPLCDGSRLRPSPKGWPDKSQGFQMIKRRGKNK